MTTPHIHCLTSLKVAGTGSFRLASGQFLGTYGANLQNPDKEALDIYIAPAGLSFVQCDQSGAEALIVAYLTRPGKYRELFNVGIKPHTFIALHIFCEDKQNEWPLAGKSPSYWKALSPRELSQEPDWKPLDKAIKSSYREYDMGKMICHASSYRMRERTFQLQALKKSRGTLTLSLAECKTFLGFFATLFPEIIEWQDEIEFNIRAKHELRNLFGYPRRFERTITDSYIREGISWIPQSTVGCITHAAINRYNRERPSNTLPAINNKHDSFLALVLDNDIKTTAKHMQSCLAISLTGRDGMNFTMKSEAQAGKNWGKYSSSNPNGMRDLA